MSVVIKIVSEAGGNKNDVTHESAGLSLSYWRPGATAQSITPASLSALDDPHTDGGILLIGNGLYRLDLPDGAVAVGVNQAVVHGAVTGGIILGVVIPLATHLPADIAGAIAGLNDVSEAQIQAVVDGLEDLSAADVLAAVVAGLTAPQTEAYHTHGEAASVRDLAYAIYAILTNHNKDGTDVIIRKQNGEQAMKLELNHAVTPSSSQRTE